MTESTRTSTDGSPPAWANRGFVAGCIVILIVVYPVLVPRRGTQGHFDHFAFAKVVELMDHGEGYYDAFTNAFGTIKDPPSQARDFRPPLPFLVWRLLPYDHLYLGYLVLVVGATSLVLLFLTRYPIAVVPVTLFLLAAGRLPGSTTNEQWLLAELWATPLIAGSLLAWRSERWWASALLASLAALTRELTFPLLLVGLLLAYRRGLPRRPWIVCGLVTGSALVLHFAVAARHTVSSGHEAKLLGSSEGLTSVLRITDFVLPEPLVLGFVLWTVSILYLARRRELWLIWPLMLVPLAGFIANRPYWGLLFEPFMVLFAAEAVLTRIITSREPARA